VSARPEKILALQFKYFGDAVLMTPALRALRAHFPTAEIHLLVPAEIAPLFQHLPWLTRVWAMPRRRGRASLRETWPLISALRRERFDRSVDFGGNDRGAILSFLIGAKRRLGWDDPGGFVGRKFCFNRRLVPEKIRQHESARLAKILSAWEVPPPLSLVPEIQVDPAREQSMTVRIPPGTILCHVTTSNQKKQWPVAHWARLFELTRAAGMNVMFSAGPAAREQQVLTELKKNVPTADTLPSPMDLVTFLVWLKRFAVVVSGDTGPLHFAAGLGVPTIGLFGPSSAERWAPVGENNFVSRGADCTCPGLVEACISRQHCLAEISPEAVLAGLKRIKLKTDVANVAASSSPELSQPILNLPLLTIAICTRNRAGYLAKAVRSVLAQADDQTEIIVVDNGSTDETLKLVADFSAADARVKLVCEPEPGLSIARNTALRTARSEWVIFLDDDAEVEPGWLAAYRKYFLHLPNPRVAVAGSVVIPRYEIPPPSWLGNRGLMDLGAQPFCFPYGDSPWETNCAFHRSAVLQVGGFDPNLGHRGSTLGSREGLDLAIRLQDAGHEIWWLPGAVIQHTIHTPRLKLNFFLRAAFNDGCAAATQHLKSRAGAARFFYITGRVLLAPLHGGLNLILALISFPFQKGRTTANALLRAARITGLAAGLLRR
jgi:ADP-heptose:LPS heptosyltransferase/GT2 family glycosyltransferase